MKEIKFRAWNKQGKYMVDSKQAIATILKKHILGGNYTDGWYTENGGEDEYEIMQFAGISDKKDKEIYEGDVLVFTQKGQSAIGQVVYKETGFWVLFSSGEFAYLYEAVKKFKGEIIGDVYSSPDLLNA